MENNSVIVKPKLTLRNFVTNSLKENEDLIYANQVSEKIEEFLKATSWLNDREVDRDIEKLCINRVLNRSLLHYRACKKEPIHQLLVLFNPRTDTKIWCTNIREQVIPFFVKKRITFLEV